MKKLLLLFIFTGLWSGSNAQVEQELVKIPDQGTITALDLFFKKYGKNPQLRYNWQYQRSLTKNFYEGFCKITWSVPDKNQPGSSTVETYHVKLIYSGKQLVTYRLTQQKYKKTGANVAVYKVDLKTYENDSLFHLLNNEFKRTYLADIDKTELLIDTIVFGSRCGLAGTDPHEKTLVDKLVEKKDMPALLGWIQSANTEKQLYGLYAYQKLKNKGYVPNEKEALILQNITMKKGTVMNCNGSIYSNIKIEMARSRINTM